MLDVAAGAGEQSLRAAERVGPTGHVLATDLAPALLERAAEDAAAAGLDQVGTLEIDGEDLQRLDAATYDAVVSRVGLIYFPDQQRALAGMRHVLREGGRVAAVVYSTPDRTRSSPCRCRSSAAGRSCRRRCRDSPARSRWAAPGCSPTR